MIGVGIPLFIVDVATPAVDQQGVVEIVEGQYRYRLLEGDFPEAEAQAVQTRLDAFQTRAQQTD